MHVHDFGRNLEHPKEIRANTGSVVLATTPPYQKAFVNCISPVFELDIRWQNLQLVFVSATVPPNIKGEEVNATVMLGHPVELHCQSDAIPPPTLTWRKDGRPLFRKPGLTVSADGSMLKVEPHSHSVI